MKKVFAPRAAAEFCPPTSFFFLYKMAGGISRHVGVTCEFKVGKKKQTKKIATKWERLADFPSQPCARLCRPRLPFPPSAPPLNSFRPTSQTINKCLLMRRSGGPLSFIISLTVNCSALILITIRRSLIAPHLVARPRRRCPTREPSGDSAFSSR